MAAGQVSGRADARMTRSALALTFALVGPVGCGGERDGADASSDQAFVNDACTVTADFAHCDSQPVEQVGVTGDLRDVYWNAPVGSSPAEGRPAVLLYQGTAAGPALSWDTDLGTDTMGGGYYQAALVSALIDAGFTVIQPEARDGLVWTTNAGTAYEGSADSVFIEEMLARIEGGRFGDIDSARLYAVGISSGGYMTSRMAVSHGGRFGALAIQSAAYATCLGPLCSTPASMPTDHPPTLFLHGSADSTVPIATARRYYETLEAQGIETDFIEDPDAAHEWLAQAPAAVTDWFSTH